MSARESSVEPKATQKDGYESLRLEIDPVIERAEQAVTHIASELPSNKGLARAARGVTEAAYEAKRVSRRLGKLIGLHRLPALFLILSLCGLSFWIYWHFFHSSKLLVAVSERDAVQLKRRVGKRVHIEPVETIGSRVSIAKLSSGEVDLAFIQGGVEIPDEFPRSTLEQSEFVLFYLREGIESPSVIRRVLTSSENQGSHSLALEFIKFWGVDKQVSFLHDWRIFTEQPDYKIPADVDAVFVVKDPMNPRIASTSARLARHQFRIVSPDLGAMAMRLDFLDEVELRPGYLDPIAGIPGAVFKTYAVSTFLVARSGLTSQQLAAAHQLLHQPSEFPVAFEPSFDNANEVAQGVEAMLGIVAYIGLAFLALLGVDVVAYRRRFNELNSLVSLISMHQASKDVLGGTREQQKHHLNYLTVCSDLLGLIAVITGYYAQENSSLLYNRLLEIINDRCNGLKINIQLKILHALIELSPSEESAEKTEIPPGGNENCPSNAQ